MTRSKSRHAAWAEAPDGRAATAAPSSPELPTDRAFVVQLTRDARSGGFSGRLEHLASGRRVRFSSLEDFLTAIGRFLD